MSRVGIYESDILIVNRTLQAQNGDIVVAVVENEFTVKRLKREQGKAWLVPQNPAYPPLDLSKVGQAHIWGVVTGSVKQFRRESASAQKT